MTEEGRINLDQLRAAEKNGGGLTARLAAKQVASAQNERWAARNQEELPQPTPFEQRRADETRNPIR